MTNKFVIDLNFNKASSWFCIIIFFIFLNAFFNFLAVSYGEGYPYNTFLFSPRDLHADLIKVALSYLRNEQIDYHEWPQLFQNYYINNGYGNLDKLQTEELTNFHLPPLTTIIALINAKILQCTDPNFLLILFYAIAFCSIFILALFFGENDKRRLFLFIMLLFSYPMLFTLTRGHIYAIITNFMTIFFFYNVFKKNNIIVPIVLMAIMFNMRPNSFFLSLLFFNYGFKKGLAGIIFSALIGIALFAVYLNIASYLYPDYNFKNFKRGVEIYYKLSVLGEGGDSFNNSLLGAFKFLKFENIEIINKIISVSLGLIALLSLYLFAKHKISSFDFIFLICSLYTLASSVFATYYMAIFYTFLLLLFKFDIRSKFTLPIVIASAFLLIPKNYIFKSYTSLEVLINPIFLLGAIVFILYKSILLDKYEAGAV